MRALGFVEDGRGFAVRDVHALACADGDLWNDRTILRMSHRGRVLEQGFQQPNLTAWAEPFRCFYVRDDATGRFWSAPHEPVCAEPDRFEFVIRSDELAWTVARDGLEVALRVAIPRGDPVELWSATVRNASRRRRRVALFPLFPVGLRGLLAQRSYQDIAAGVSVHEYFPYYVRHEDHPRLARRANLVFCAGDARPAAWELSLAAFAGEGDLRAPDAVAAGRLRSPRAPWEVANERACAAFRLPVSLAPGAGREFRFVFGPAHDRREVARLRQRYLRPGGFEAVRAESAAFRAHYPGAVRARTPDRAFDHYVNHWQPRRSLILARTLRHNLGPQGRNAIQDAMGGAYVDPAASRAWFLRIWRHQRRDGGLPHGMPFAEGVEQPAINSIPHRDINAWGAPALRTYVAETGDAALLDEAVPFADAPAENAPLFEHIALGLEWLLRDRTRRGLSRIGQGDWCDPLNRAGLRDRGESTWLSAALAHALDAWADVAACRGDAARARRWAREADRVRAAINRHAWDGGWYARGFTDAGEPFGVAACREGRIFLNAQSWTLLCGAARGRRAAACIRAVERYLATPWGAMTLAPPYTRWDPRIGKLTQKTPGWNENGSVYCHDSAFYASALYAVRRPDRAFAMLRALLPGAPGNPVARCGQVPLYLPNFFRGTAAGPAAGLSSHAPNTGTAAWYYRIVVEQLFGLRAELGGLRVDPQLPSAWRGARVLRRWRGAEFDVRIGRIRPGARPRVTLDGRPLRGNLVPPQPPGTRHLVRVD